VLKGDLQTVIKVEW